ncbi:MAG: hypothetical protein INQ03_04265 [Candidatus Heimdallarchaeota archaeon]|nr:hypothetical protein [Candidatus Heimdallarchaeota archaeon]
MRSIFIIILLTLSFPFGPSNATLVPNQTVSEQITLGMEYENILFTGDDLVTRHTYNFSTPTNIVNLEFMIINVTAENHLFINFLYSNGSTIHYVRMDVMKTNHSLPFLLPSKGNYTLQFSLADSSGEIKYLSYRFQLSTADLAMIPGDTNREIEFNTTYSGIIGGGLIDRDTDPNKDGFSVYIPAEGFLYFNITTLTESYTDYFLKEEIKGIGVFAVLDKSTSMMRSYDYIPITAGNYLFVLSSTFSHHLQYNITFYFTEKAHVSHNDNEKNSDAPIWDEIMYEFDEILLSEKLDRINSDVPIIGGLGRIFPSSNDNAFYDKGDSYIFKPETDGMYDFNVYYLGSFASIYHGISEGRGQSYNTIISIVSRSEMIDWETNTNYGHSARFEGSQFNMMANTSQSMWFNSSEIYLITIYTDADWIKYRLTFSHAPTAELLVEIDTNYWLDVQIWPMVFLFPILAKRRRWTLIA